MNAISRITLATRVAANAALKSVRIALGSPGVMNRYEAAKRWQGGHRSSIWSFVTDARFDATQADRFEIVRKARYFEANNPLVQRLADLWELYTVGANGLIISPQTENYEWAATARERYREWCVAPDACSLLSMTQTMSLASRLWFIDGEAFILLTRTTSAPYRPRIQLIESHRVGTPPAMAGQEGVTIVDGVQIDVKGRPVGYWVRDDFEGEKFAFVPAEYMIHLAEPNRQGMYRPLSFFYAVMNVLHDLDDLALLEMSAAKEAARVQKIIKTPSGELPDDEWDEVTQDAASANPQKEYYERVFGAETKVMFTGDEYEQFTSNRPTVAQQWYWRHLAEQICIGSSGVPLVLVYPDSMQGTVYRGVLDMAAQTFKARSSVPQDASLRIWRYFIEFDSRVDVALADKPKDWRSATVRPPRAVNVDVGRNSSAMLAEFEAGMRTLSDIFSETGDDWQEKVEQKAKEMAFIKRMAEKHSVEAQEVTRFAVKSPEDLAKERKLLTPPTKPDEKKAAPPEGMTFAPVFNYRDDQARDNDGKWDDEGGGGAGRSRSGKVGIGKAPALKAVKERAFNGERVETETQLTKTETGKTGESIVMRLQRGATVACRSRNNFATDVLDLKRGELIEVKTGLVSNSDTAQHWRATIGQPGKAEAALIKKMNPATKKAYNRAKMDKVMARKDAALKKMQKTHGRKLKPVTLTIILNPDKRTVDVYKFSGFHERIPWDSKTAKEGYAGSYKY